MGTTNAAQMQMAAYMPDLSFHHLGKFCYSHPSYNVAAAVHTATNCRRKHLSPLLNSGMKLL
jgi:hypothetical protein